MTGLLHSSDGPGIFSAPTAGHVPGDFLEGSTRTSPTDWVRSRREAAAQR